MVAGRIEIASEDLELLQGLEDVSHGEVFRKTRVDIVLDRLHERIKDFFMSTVRVESVLHYSTSVSPTKFQEDVELERAKTWTNVPDLVNTSRSRRLSHRTEISILYNRYTAIM